ncbi:bifunctional (p)ppGpp synthetase/guanosine-3',5'-bis(diphosphate) 3'-pyrophosphohydrolase [Clostridium tyrobutyricum]|mgnify:FL=1|uniref:RelA/SpoT family protein n=1 Tax=Clostridium tyrobutyricum TaxID=1519 RepID=UPI00057DFBAB|nr:bifunctional (p)ppGpp synthetase/guanosine-3',5'-bis(diphosphate) 3'-pyrophosphohydrolase [Clostridium tyrobutyricum]MBV4439205.1 bifunctional (p)ppGpp synthetase/guanosine-3',5'-bis(diphosphate) 3'-pyrophosphohydrolase [Clostridium tyrobutyricum]MBV4446570.1 bifunctional (p)ppGpp synthetase/guanosine-3',5'-bis(diphosphate) 3'-pyrophosphohydrolase [Clostridium tyrobutyricum]MBV4448854.1 bifunctional (p)ppGpp synthetase/guanosine-3',5'-bis(diphosphate) 3'-pyrophosphohydrolase [Clostridium tyro
MLEKLMKKIEKNCTNINKEMVKKAYQFADKAHKKQKRESGDPYIMHPVEVACILADMGMDTSTIVAGLLHDVVEDTDFTHDDITREFSAEVANLVEGVTKLGRLEYKTRKEQQADNVRKMLLAMAKDIRVILIKLADRLHNMRTLKYMPVEKQKEKSKETLDIYAPLAHRLGISKVKWELEDLSLRYLNPNEYYFIVRKIAEKRGEREKHIEQIIHELKENLEDAEIDSDIAGRPKHFYSIYRKMVNKNKTIDQIFDLTAVRVLVDTVKDCYAALGIAHTMYKPIPGRFKDYIAMPKPNMYQSLHSTVIGPQGKPFEIQIRTFEMHKTAEYGIAAHWKYKEGVSTEDTIDKKLTWIREMLDWQTQTSDADEFMEGFKIDLFSDEVFVFTPQGNVINLPYEATPIDFAYKIHTDIGNNCAGAKVNGKMVPLDYKLKTGEIVEISVSSVSKGPSIDWLNVVKSNQAKSKIKSWFKKARKEENILKGKELLEKETKKHGYNLGDITKEDGITAILKKYNMNSIEDLYAAIGIGVVNLPTIVSKLTDIHEAMVKKNITDWRVIQDQFNKNSNRQVRNKKKSPGIIVKGETNVLVRFAQCCNPVPGDSILGYITKGRGVSIHRYDCKNLEHLLKNKENKLIEVSWGRPKGEEYITEIQIKSEDRPGLLADSMEVVSNSKTSLYAVDAKPSKNGIAIITMKLKITDINDLKDVIKKLRKMSGTIEVYRTNS